MPVFWPLPRKPVEDFNELLKFPKIITKMLVIQLAKAIMTSNLLFKIFRSAVPVFAGFAWATSRSIEFRGNSQMSRKMKRTSAAARMPSLISIALLVALSIATAGVGAAPGIVIDTFASLLAIAPGASNVESALSNNAILDATVLIEEFEYTTGQLTDLNGGANVSGGNWIDFSGSGNPIMVNQAVGIKANTATVA